MDPVKVVTCDCGFEAVGVDDDLVEIVQSHERDVHHNEITHDEVLAMAMPVDPAA